jgi:hypothetical protein
MTREDPMAKSTQPAAPGDATSDEPAGDEASTPPMDEQLVDETVEQPETVVSFWRYTGEEQRVYPHVPVTVDQGDVIAWVGVPAADGRWEQHPGPITRDPDNTPKPAPQPGAQDASVEE